MKKIHMWMLAAACLAGMTANCATAYGAQSSVIESVSVSIKTTYGEPEEIPEPVITVGTKDCTLLDYQYSTDYENWKPGKKVRIEMTIQAESGKYFPASMTRSRCKVTGADFVSARSLDEDTLQVKADYKPVTVLGDTEKAGWSKNNKKRAVWKSVDFAPGYTLTLYGDNKVVKRMTVETNNANLSDYMKDMDKTYYYEVKAVPVTSEEKKYLKEGNYVSSTDQEFDWDDYEEEAVISQRPGDGGEFKGDTYTLPDGSRAVNTWKKTGGKWYFFDGSGKRVKGWLHTGDRWYYMDSNGAMCTGWVRPDGSTWYFLDENGEMRTGWIQSSPGTWYYLDQDGRMRTGWIQPPSGAWYYLADDGHMQTGWVYIGDKWYYLEADGHMLTGWLYDKGEWYYLESSGNMAVNTTIDGWQIGADGTAHQES